MNSEIADKLKAIAERTLESLAFMLPVDDEPGDTAQSGECWASVDFFGPFRGTLCVSASSNMLEALAANMLGLDVDDGIDASHRHDSLKELLNVICGNLLPEIAGTEAVFNVAAPEVTVEGQMPDDIGDAPAVASVHVCMDEGEIDLAMFITQEAQV